MMQATRLAINKVHFPVTTLGYGRRIAIWTQGCSICCPGCISRDTWSSDAGQEIAIDALIEGHRPWLAKADGVTISGGEPFEQPSGVYALLQALRREHTGDILVYSGFGLTVLEREFPDILKLIDVLIPEPYVPAVGQSLALRGSDNQRVLLLTELARQRYPANIEHLRRLTPPRLDIVVDGDTVWMAGIPEPNAMRGFKERLRLAGYTLRSSDEPMVRA
jgi:anaerobic ribonucleoside-triphosphate reductase activating protein